MKIPFGQITWKYSEQVILNISQAYVLSYEKESKGRRQRKKKNVFFRALPELPKPPPPMTPIRATLPTLSGRQKRRFARMAEKNTDDDNNCCHDNFDQNFGNFDDNDDKKY